MRVLFGQRLQHGHQFGVLSQPEPGVVQVEPGGEVLGLERGPDRPQTRRLQAGEGLTRPQRQRLRQHLHPAPVVGRCRGDEFTEAVEVDRARIGLQHVPTGALGDREVRRQSGAQAGQVAVERLPRLGGQRLTPQVVDEPLGPHHAVHVEQQERQDGAHAGVLERAVVDRDLAKQAEPSHPRRSSFAACSGVGAVPPRCAGAHQAPGSVG